MRKLSADNTSLVGLAARKKEMNWMVGN